jgi:hypothetical protein
MRRVRESVIVSANALQGLQNIVAELNRVDGGGLAPSALALRGIVQQWQDSGPNLVKLCFSDLHLWAEAQHAFHPTLKLTKSGCAHVNFLSNIGAPGVMASLGAAGVRHYALCFFNALLINPLWQKLGGPCVRCKNYYVKNRRNQKLYCGRRCGSLASAERCTRERLDRERKKKLDKARELAQRWVTVSTDKDWKQWIHGKDKEITPKWLTIAANKYGLEPPVRKGHRHFSLDPGVLNRLT